MVSTLLAQKAPDADALCYAAREAEGCDGHRFEICLSLPEAARPDAETKKHYFDDYLHNSARQEDWVQDSLANFNSWNASDLTALYLKPGMLGGAATD